MNPAIVDSSPQALVDRLVGATNAHDVDALVDCFAIDYRNETPAHPTRGFTGREQVRTNWQRIFAGVPDLRVTVLGSAVTGNTIWTEWEMSGTRLDGTEHLMRGVILFGVAADRASWARFYLEPVDHGSGTVDTAITAQLRGRAVDAFPTAQPNGGVVDPAVTAQLDGGAVDPAVTAQLNGGAR